MAEPAPRPSAEPPAEPASLNPSDQEAVKLFVDLLTDTDQNKSRKDIQLDIAGKLRESEYPCALSLEAATQVCSTSSELVGRCYDLVNSLKMAGCSRRPADLALASEIFVSSMQAFPNKLFPVFLRTFVGPLRTLNSPTIKAKIQVEAESRARNLVDQGDVKGAIPLIVSGGVISRFDIEGLIKALVKVKHSNDAFRLCRLLNSPSVSKAMLHELCKGHLSSALAKQAWKFIKECQFDPKEFPTVLHSRAKSQLAWLLKQSDEIDRSLIDDLLLSFPEFQEDFASRLVTRKPGSALAQRIVSKFGLNAMFPDVRALSSAEVKALEEKEDQQLLEEMAAPQYLQLPTDVSLDFVDNQQDLDKVWKSLQPERFIGFDCEWKPKGATDVDPSFPSVLQLSGEKHVFVLDLPALLRVCKEQLFEFWRLLFREGEPYVVGFAIREDARILKTFRHSATSKKEQEADGDDEGDDNYGSDGDGEGEAGGEANSGATESKSDSTLAMHVVDGIDLLKASDAKVPKSGLSLSAALEQHVGKSLSKSIRLSNWDERPLRRPQLLYAGLDAYAVYLIISKLNPTQEMLKANTITIH